MTEHRWSKFWWADYKGDDSLRSCSLAAQGLWMRLLCAMHEGTPYGHLTINGKPPTIRQIAAIASAPEREVPKLLEELADAGVFSTTDDGLIFSRRMVRDKAISDRARVDGKTGGNPALKGGGYPGGLTPPDKPGGYTLESESEAEAESERKNPPPRGGGSRTRAGGGGRGTRLPEGWQPADPAIAADLGLDQPFVLAKFQDHFAALPGDRGQSANWDAAWRTWCRREVEMKRTPYQPRQAAPVRTSQMSVGEQDAELVRLMRETTRVEDETPPALRLVQ